MGWGRRHSAVTLFNSREFCSVGLARSHSAVMLFNSREFCSVGLARSHSDVMLESFVLCGFREEAQ